MACFGDRVGTPCVQKLDKCHPRRVYNSLAGGLTSMSSCIFIICLKNINFVIQCEMVLIDIRKKGDILKYFFCVSNTRYHMTRVTRK